MSRPVVSACLLVVVLPFIAPGCAATQLAMQESSLADAAPVLTDPVIGPENASGHAGDVSGQPPASTELRDALAQVVSERNMVASQRDSLLQQRWLTVVYATIASLLALWFMWANLRRPHPGLRPVEAVTLPSATRSGTRERPRNATITIRNAATQQPEVIERVETRRLFRPRQPQTTTRVVAPARTPPANPVAAPAEPSPTSSTSSTPPRTGTTSAVTVRMTAPAPAKPPGYAPTGVFPPRPVTEPTGTTQVRIARRDGRVLARQGLSLLEVMISLAILATVLASVSGGIFVLSSAHRSANEEAAVSMVMRRWSERIMGADWEWLGREHLDDSQRGAWSWQRPEIDGPPLAGDHPPLIEESSSIHHDANVQLLDDQPSRLADLRCYLEYYRPVALELSFTPTDSATARAAWDEVRTAYRLPPPVDLRGHADAVVVRLSATWTAQDGGKRRRDLIFARTR